MTKCVRIHQKLRKCFGGLFIFVKSLVTSAGIVEQKCGTGVKHNRFQSSYSHAKVVIGDGLFLDWCREHFGNLLPREVKLTYADATYPRMVKHYSCCLQIVLLKDSTMLVELLFRDTSDDGLTYFE